MTMFCKDIFFNGPRSRQSVCGGLLGYLILGMFLWSSLGLLPLSRGDDADLPGLKAHYENLYNLYTSKESSIKSDCKLKSDSSGEDLNRIHWGTIETLKFLSGKMTDMTKAEERMNLPKLRQFLARMGYLKDPGSLLFLDKQTTTVSLTGCKEGAVWRRQGGVEDFKKFQDEFRTGDKLKGQAPNGLNYIHKYTCFTVGEEGKCSHTFYVITKMLPELPFGLLVRENLPADGEFSCTVPYCQLKDCEDSTDKPIPRRSYPPFKVSWVVPEKVKKYLNSGNRMIAKEDYPKIKNVHTEQSYRMEWTDEIRKNEKAELELDSSYRDVLGFYDWVDGFGENKEKAHDPNVHSFQARILILRGDDSNHIGLYECVIEDNNGVVSTPNHVLEGYRGDVNVFVIDDKLYYSYAVAGGCLVLVAIIILVCPRKLEHDDGEVYAKEELMGEEHREEKVAGTSRMRQMQANSLAREGRGGQENVEKKWSFASARREDQPRGRVEDKPSRQEIRSMKVTDKPSRQEVRSMMVEDKPSIRSMKVEDKPSRQQVTPSPPPPPKEDLQPMRKAEKYAEPEINAEDLVPWVKPMKSNMKPMRMPEDYDQLQQKREENPHPPPPPKQKDDLPPPKIERVPQDPVKLKPSESQVKTSSKKEAPVKPSKSKLEKKSPKPDEPDDTARPTESSKSLKKKPSKPDQKMSAMPEKAEATVEATESSKSLEKKSSNKSKKSEKPEWQIYGPASISKLQPHT